MTKFNKRLAMGAVLVLGLAPWAPAVAEQGGGRQGEKAQAQSAPGLNLSKEERAALTPVQTALEAKNFDAAAAALSAAQPAIKGTDARYFASVAQLQIGLGKNDKAMQLAGIEGMLATGKVAQADLPKFYNNIASLATDLGDFAKAEQAVSKLTQIAPNDPGPVIGLAQAKIKQNRPAEAVTLLDRAITIQKASGQAVPESWYRVALGQAATARLAPQVTKLGSNLVASYPNPKNWHDVLGILMELSGGDRDTEIDIYRLMRATKSLTSPNDYAAYTRVLSNAGLPGEVKAVLDEGVAANVINATDARFGPLRNSVAGRIAADKAALPAEEKKALAGPSAAPLLGVANAYYAYGDYAKAAALYRAALNKGSVDANVVNTRLGMALALSGQKAEAETAFKAISGKRSDLGVYLLAWLSQRA
jgi:tetratricopeptide (TPR) repeat protein